MDSVDDALATHQRQRIGVYVLLGLAASALLVLLLMDIRKAMPTSADRKLKPAC